ncbi:nitrite reductase (NADH) large subunit [Barrientosiimonas humi]|uniref:assimilatory sulfite reductase (ferredoxin) n=1 Tax=Barrientosiimonas humi TaxID=999931 RepID=A0A542XET0_9MICO|nr:nitrite reductase large subunit NirB [Barrientosiimonas humi]TQL34329.1 nitrite reductase (NADH) large subunit [Barrientosiimonas humi]CAG7574321.1 Nitrite reductase [NAD(P)H] [Barrientosiimonas humi]
MSEPQHVVVVGGGMVAHRFVEALRERDTDGRWRVTVLAEEPRPPYDRVALTTYFTGRDPEDLNLGEAHLWADPLVRLRKGVAATSINKDSKQIRLSTGETLDYDHLVLATGSFAAVPPVRGTDHRGCFVYRTIDDVADLRGYVEQLRADRPDRVVRGLVVGGGLLGLEAAGALQALGAESTVVEFAPRLMPLQVDPAGGEALARLIGRLGVDVRVGAATEAVLAKQGAVSGVRLAGGERIATDVVVFATGVRPRDELAREAGLPVGERGGVVVDGACATDDPAISAIGEVACVEGAVWGLVAPGYAMAEVTVDRLLGGSGTFPGADASTKLKLLGVDVASFGDAFATAPGALEVVWSDSVAGVYKKLVVSDDAQTLLGGILVGDAAAYAALRPRVGRLLPGDPSSYIAPESTGAQVDSADLPDDVGVCSCNNVTAGAVRAAVAEQGCCSLTEVKACTKAGTSCGSCLPLVKKLVETEQRRAGIEVSTALCEHFALSRAELFDAVRVTGLTSFTDIVDRHGVGGNGCDICKPVVASILASLGSGHILAGEQAALQDTNDHLLANLQKDGTYSVVPRVPGGEITPDGLIVIGEVARDFGLYTKITGGQRIDMFGARVDQLPLIWRRLVDAGFESGHAYGKSLRTVKSCVGQTWCRYGVQDSVAMAVLLELRYRGLRSPHKLKLGVSGCARECAEARGKDVGVIATENGWNLYVGGNGGFTPRHADLLAEDLDDETLVRTIDRFFMYYVRTADRLQRTAAWLADLDGGVEQLRRVVLDDALGIAADLDAAMEAHVSTYSDEWRDVLEDPEKLARFSSFVNAQETSDPSLQYVLERGQARPATADERVAAARGEVELVDSERRPVVIAGDRIPVRS